MKKIYILLFVLFVVLGIQAQERILIQDPSATEYMRPKGSWGFELGTHNVVHYNLNLGLRARLRAALGATLIDHDGIPSGLAPYLNLDYRHLLGSKEQAFNATGLYAGVRVDGYTFKPGIWWRDLNFGGQVGALRLGPIAGFIFPAGPAMRMYAEVGLLKGFAITDGEGKIKFEPRQKLHFHYALGVAYSI